MDIGAYLGQPSWMEFDTYEQWEQRIRNGTDGDFGESVRRKEAAAGMDAMDNSPDAEAEAEQEAWNRKLEKWDQEMERLREQNKRYQEWMEEQRAERKRKQKALMEKELLLEHLIRRDEVTQELERAAMERALGEDFYIEKAPRTKGLSAAQLLELCGE